MLPTLSALALAGGLLAWPPAQDAYLFRMQKSDHPADWPREVYTPREADVVLYDDHNAFLTRIYRLVGTDSPLHAGIVFRKPDGACALLEAGAHGVPRVRVLDIDTRLREYRGTVLVRRLKSPLNAGQARKLTEFCLAQEGKSYAVLRLMLQGTPLRPHGWLDPVLGKTSLERDRWICSELVVAGATAAGVLNPKDYHANAIYPHDLAYDDRVDLSAYYEPPALWYPRDELEFTAKGALRVPPGPLGKESQ